MEVWGTKRRESFAIGLSMCLVRLVAVNRVLKEARNARREPSLLGDDLNN